MTDPEKETVRAWSKVVAAGADGSPDDVQRELASRGVVATVDDVARRLASLRSQGALP